VAVPLYSYVLANATYGTAVKVVAQRHCASFVIPTLPALTVKTAGFGENGGVYSPSALLELALKLWPAGSDGMPYVVFTGGEPALQLTDSLVAAFKEAGFETAVESNGTLPLPKNLDWVCISPKGKSDVIIKQCDELKLVFPQDDLQPEQVNHISASHYFISPMAYYGENESSGMIVRENMQAATQYCLKHPKWRMSLQTHKLLGID